LSPIVVFCRNKILPIPSLHSLHFFKINSQVVTEIAKSILLRCKMTQKSASSNLTWLLFKFFLKRKCSEALFYLASFATSCLENQRSFLDMR